LNKLLQLSIFSILLLVPAGAQNVLAGNGCVPPPSGMISWWPGDDNANDIVDANNGVLENGAFFAAGKVGSGFGFDGIDDMVRVPHNANQNPGAEMTVDAWINPDVISHGQSIINKRTSSNLGDGGFTFETTHSPFGPNNGLQFGIGTDVSGVVVLITGANVITTDVFQHVAATYDGSMMRIYVDGVEVASTAASGNIKPITPDLVIGRNSVIPSFDFDGIIDEVEFFNRALSTPEIQAIFNADSAGKCKIPEPPEPEPQVVGGEIIPIETTALLLAGAQTSAIWMAPLLAGTVVAATIYIKKKRN